jgi:hypothetical protein
MKCNFLLRISTVLISLIFIQCSSSKIDQSALKNPVDISLNPYVNRLVTVETIAGKDTFQLIFDTGGGETLISPEIAKRLGHVPSGRSVGYRMTGEQVEFQYCPDITLTIGGIPFHHEEIAVWDIHSILPKELPPVDGILSLKTFQNQPFTLNLSSKKLILETPQSLSNSIKSMTRLRSRIATGLGGSEINVFLHGKAQKSGWYLLDCGNLDVVLLSEKLNIKSSSDSISSSGVWESEFIFDNLEPVLTKFRKKDIIYDGALSAEFMNDFIFTFDLSSNGVWISPIEKSLSK